MGSGNTKFNENEIKQEVEKIINTVKENKKIEKSDQEFLKKQYTAASKDESNIITINVKEIIRLFCDDTKCNQRDATEGQNTIKSIQPFLASFGIPLIKPPSFAMTIVS